MPNKYTQEEYAAMLPKKQVGVAVLFFNEIGELLIVKPDYKEHWLVVGGSTDEDESPLHSAIRETKEETGLDITDLKLIGVHYSHKKGFFVDSLRFIYYGGILTKEQIALIKLPADELEDFRFSPTAAAMTLLSTSLKICLPACLEAIKNGTVAYTEQA